MSGVRITDLPLVVESDFTENDRFLIVDDGKAKLLSKAIFENWVFSNVKGEKGDTGAVGAKGDKGDSGTITNITATTLPSGFDASVNMGGTPEARTFEINVPKGEKGDTGSQGDKGEKGDDNYQLAVKSGFEGSYHDWVKSTAADIGDEAANILLGGFVTIDSFEQGATITQRKEALRHAVDGKLYRWGGDLPKVVPASSTPANSGGVATDAWLEVSDATLRQDIVTGGLITDALVATTGGLNQSTINNGLPNVSALPSNGKKLDGMRVLVKGVQKGYFVYDSTKANVNNHGTVINGWVRDIADGVLTPEMFKDYEGDDWTQALVNMFKSCTDMPTGSGIEGGLIYAKLRSGNHKKVRLSQLYRHTKPIHIPPNVTVEQVNKSGYFNKNVGTIGLYYDPSPSEYNTYAVAPFLYKEDKDTGLYSLDTDLMTLPLEPAIDLDYIQTGQRITLNNLSITTNPNVTLGFRCVGFAGSTANNLNVGANDGTESRNPKVAVLVNSAWNATFNNPTTLSSIQGWVNWGSNGGLVINSPYINQGHSAIPLKDIKPIFNPEGHTETGSIGIVNQSDCFWNQPVTEHWYFHYVCNWWLLRVLHPHIEGRSTRNVFYFVGSANAEITLKNIITVAPNETLASLIYLKNCSVTSHVALKGSMMSTAPVVLGEGSEACVAVDLARAHFQIQEGSWGNINLIRSINNTWGEKVIYVDPVTGDDNAIGLRDINALKSLTNVKRLCELMDIKEVKITSNLTYTTSVTLPSQVTFTGAEIAGAGDALMYVNGNVDITFNNAALKHTGGQGLLYLNGTTRGNITFNCPLNSPEYAVVAQSFADISITYLSTTNSTYALVFGGAGYTQLVTFIKASPTASKVARIVDGSAVVKYTNII